MTYFSATRRKMILSVFLLWAFMFFYMTGTGVAGTKGDFYFGPFAEVDLTEKEDGTVFVNATEYSEAVTLGEDGEAFGRILIYHTHTNEAYERTDENRFSSLASRSGDYSLTVKTVGDTMQETFAKFGIDSDHSVENNEAEGYNNAYRLSKALIGKMNEENGEYAMYIDVHRDAYSKNSVPTVEIDGESVAKVMLVVGGKSEHYEENRKLAQKIADALFDVHPKLCRKVLVVESSVYNQTTDGCLLIEIGDNSNTVAEANRAAEYVAKAIAKVINCADD